MIVLENLSKSFPIPGGRKYVVRDVSVTFPTRTAVALLGRNGTGKSTLLEMIGGSSSPDSGRIWSTGSISWPVGFAGSFHRELSGAQNTRFIARAYGVDTDDLCAFVKEFSELKSQFHMPIRSYSAGMKSRLAFGISMGIRFDTYLVAEVTSVGDASFKQKSLQLFRDRMTDSGAIMVSHSMRQVRRFCDAGAVLEDGNLIYYDDIDEAIARHQENMGSDEDE